MECTEDRIWSLTISAFLKTKLDSHLKIYILYISIQLPIDNHLWSTYAVLGTVNTKIKEPGVGGATCKQTLIEA